MRIIAMTAALALMAAPAIGLAQTAPQAPPAASSEGQQAGQSFRDAGGSISDAAKSTWHGLQHGWEATKEGARAGWSAATKGSPPEPHSPEPAQPTK